MWRGCGGRVVANHVRYHILVAKLLHPLLYRLLSAVCTPFHPRWMQHRRREQSEGEDTPSGKVGRSDGILRMVAEEFVVCWIIL